MKYRKFGKTDWNVSEIGFGAWAIGGGWGPVDDQESISTLLSAWDMGINFVDTAEMYGKGHSESVIGRALKEWSGQHIYVATKVQPVNWPHPNEDDPEMIARYPSTHIRQQCEASLERLNVETIDLYQLHGWFPKGVQETEWYDALLQLKQEGKIREIGISIRDYRPQDGVDIARTGKVASEQVVYNIFEQRPEDALFSACKEHDVAVIARVPFDESALVGNWTENTYDTFSDNDIRRPYFKGERFKRTYEKVEQIKSMVREMTGDRYGMLAEVALRFCLSNPVVSCVIPGMMTIEHMRANTRVSDGELLPKELLEALKIFNWPRNYHNPDEGVDPYE
jgi:aryl-alcohol dehydrogenase-like predicted oxidoreductase